MTRCIALAVFFLLAGLCQGQPQIVGKLEYPPHALVRLRVDGVPEKTGFMWRVHGPGFVDKATTAKDTLQFAAPPGTYDVEVILVSIDGQGNPSLDAIQTRVVIGGTPPGPTPPGPTPPGPTPPGPTPPDDLVKELKALYDTDTGSIKQRVGKQLVGLYQYGAQVVLDKAYTTSGELDVALYRKAKDTTENGLDGIRQRVADKCKTVLGTSDPKTVLTDDKRKALADLFTRLAKALDEIAR